MGSELYDLKEDPDERNNLSNSVSQKNTISSLSKELSKYFDKFSEPKFDLWNGGSAKSNVSNYKFWKTAWGSEWKTTF